MTALLRRIMDHDVSAGAVDRAIKVLQRCSPDNGIRTTIPAKDGKRAGHLLDRDLTAPAPNRV